jgi:hypothetical protein
MMPELHYATVEVVKGHLELISDLPQRSILISYPGEPTDKIQVALDGFSYDQGKPKIFKQENGVVREFCDNCGAFICEYGVSLFLNLY